ncbi:hypothetical protein FSP39_017711 [Pinctada imbricata]|uniref:TIR domain-containing protein n=1 Tax=Pinctada imbricata TaxID=66713 RepID=A0AA88YNN6_PINIB|nr:hypothetical protein FSP39_017711 [Pinctada imbricata]
MLDIGAGTGLVAEELQKHGFKTMDALDASSGMLQKAREKGIYRNLICETITAEPLDIPKETFQYLKLLKYLDLSFNRISVLSPHVFKSLVNLRQLKLRDNLIEDFKNVELEHLSGLLLLDLSGNQLPTLNIDIRNSLSEIRKHSHLKINITSNPLRCNCEDIDFWRWMSDSDFILDAHGVTCKVGKLKHFFKNSTKVTDIIIEMDKLCASYVGIVAGVSCTIGLLIALIIGGTVYRYRWKLRYLFYMTKSKYFGYAEIGRDYTERNFIFDCFISYADGDRGFALHKVMNYLEKTTGLKLCFHQRDFVPGIDIAQNITNAIHQSRKTICVLSPNYLNSYWCMYELNMAKMESIYSRNGENILILVFYQHVSPNDIPLSVMSIIEQKSYIEYPGDEQGDIVFWNKLKEVIEL